MADALEPRLVATPSAVAARGCARAPGAWSRSRAWALAVGPVGALGIGTPLRGLAQEPPALGIAGSCDPTCAQGEHRLGSPLVEIPSVVAFHRSLLFLLRSLLVVTPHINPQHLVCIIRVPIFSVRPFPSNFWTFQRRSPVHSSTIGRHHRSSTVRHHHPRIRQRLSTFVSISHGGLSL